MTGTASDKLAAIALEAIRTAFASRPQPAQLTDSMQLSDIEYAEVMAFEGLLWQDVSFALIEENADAVFWFAPQAFCYYLPGFLAAGLREQRWDTNAYDAIIGCLDRSPEPDYWDDFFRPRWTLLRQAEIDAVGAWTEWLEAVQPDITFGNSYERARDTLALLKRHNGVAD